MKRFIYYLVVMLTCVSTKLHAENIVFADANVKSLYNELADFARNEKEAGTHPVLTSSIYHTG